MRVDMENRTTCAICGGELPPRRRTFCSAECKVISEKARARKRYLADREAWIAQSRQWKVNNPDRARELARAYGIRHRADTREREAAYVAANRDRYSDHSRAWYYRNTEKGRLLGRLNASARRARIKDNGVFLVTPRDIRRAWHRHRGCCAYCGTKLSAADFDWDHVIPIKHGGRHSIGNFVPSCPQCNRSKGAKFVTEWRSTCPR